MNHPGTALMEAGRLPAPGRSVAGEGWSGRRIGVARLLRVVRHQLLLIAGTVVAVMILAVAVLARTVPEYAASTVMMVEAQPQGPVGNPAELPTAATTAADEMRIATRIELLQSRTLVERLAAALQVDRDPEFGGGLEAGSKPAGRIAAFLHISPPIPEIMTAGRTDPVRAMRVTERLRNAISVDRIDKSRLIRITASSTNPSRAAQIANGLAELHLSLERDRQQNAARRAIARLTERAEAVGAEVRDAERAVASYRRAHGLFVARPDGLNQAQMAQLAGTLSQARLGRAQSSSRSTLFGLSQGTGAASPLLNDLRAQEATLSKRLAELSTTYGSNYSGVVSARAQLGDVRGQIASEVRRIAAGLRSEAAIGNAAEGQVAADMGTLRSRGFAEVGAAPGLLDLERQAETGNALYVGLLGDLKKLASKGGDTNLDMSIASRAQVPLEPVRPMPRRVLGVAFLASLGLGLLLATAREARDTRIRDSEDVEDRLDLSVLAMVPKVIGRPSGPLYRLLATHPRSSFAEAMTSLATELRLQRPDNGAQVVTITSPIGGEGRITVATSLAAAASRMGFSAAVIDLDLRRPGLIHNREEGEGTGDLVDYLMGRVPLEAVLAPDPAFASLSIAGVGKSDVDPGSLVASRQMERLVAELRKRFDFVVLNTPPIFAVRDAKLIGRFADTRLLVLGWGETRIEVARLAADLIGQPTGVILNRVDYALHRRRGDGGVVDHYRGFSRYYNDAQISAAPGDRVLPPPTGRSA